MRGKSVTKWPLRRFECKSIKNMDKFPNLMQICKHQGLWSAVGSGRELAHLSKAGLVLLVFPCCSNSLP